MTHLYIEQDTGSTEEVNLSIISKLYELASSGDLDNTSDLKGRLHTTSAKEKHVTYLTQHYSDLYINADIQYLEFSDPDVETLMKRYIGTSDGVTITDVQNFVSSGTAFGAQYVNLHTGNRNNFANTSEREPISTFNELSLFTGLQSIDIGALSCPNMTSIQLPSSVTKLRNYAFEGFAGTSIDLSNIEIIEAGVFQRAKLAGVINLPSLVKFENYYNYGVYGAEGRLFLGCYDITQVNIGPNFEGLKKTLTFYGCSSLLSVTGLQNTTTIPSGTFYECTNLTTTDIPYQNITKIGVSSFYKCRNISALETINLPNLVDDGGGLSNAFNGCTLIKHVIDLGSITTLISRYGSDGTFSGCTGLLDAVLPETLTEIGLAVFSQCSNMRYVKILATNLVTYNLLNGFNHTLTYGGSFGESWRNSNPSSGEYMGLTYPIYVPDALLSQYQAADGWKYVGPNRLRPLSQFATDFPNG